MSRIREYRAYTVEQIPSKNMPEIAIIGRSNVGKSSIINTLLNYKTALVSQRPGSTLWLGMHELGPVRIIDLPGYGYAKTSKDRKNLVSDLTISYFDLKRTDLILLLVDMRRGILEIDHVIIDLLDQYLVPIRFIGTKADKKDAIHKEFDVCCSVETKEGIKALKDLIQSTVRIDK